MGKVYINLNIVEDFELSGNAFSVYCAIMRGGAREGGVDILDSTSIGYWLYERSIDRNERDRIRKGIKELEQKGLMSIKLKLNDSVFVYNTEAFDKDITSTRYTYLNKEDIVNIMNIGVNYNGGLLMYYTYIVFSMLKKGFNERFNGKISIERQDIIASNCFISNTTAKKYEKILCDHHILYKLKCFHTKISNSNGRYLTVKNIYSRYDDRNLCKDFINEKKGQIMSGERFLYKNEIRSALQKYEWMKKGKEYPEYEVEMIYNMVKEWNEEKKKEYTKGKIEKLELKDLSVFNKYGLEE